MLAAKDGDGKVHLCWVDPNYLKSIHKVENCDEEFQMISDALLHIATGVAQK